MSDFEFDNREYHPEQTEARLGVTQDGPMTVFFEGVDDEQGNTEWLASNLTVNLDEAR